VPLLSKVNASNRLTTCHRTRERVDGCSPQRKTAALLCARSLLWLT